MTESHFNQPASRSYERPADQNLYPAPMQGGREPVVVQPGPLPLEFTFKGGAASWFGTQLAGALVTLCTFGICYPWAVVMVYRWKTRNTYVNGHQMRFTGDAMGLFGHWIKWWILTVITLGIYSFWVYPRMVRWTTEHQRVQVDQTSYQLQGTGRGY